MKPPIRLFAAVWLLSLLTLIMAFAMSRSRALLRPVANAPAVSTQAGATLAHPPRGSV
jgi:hypothetical protein